MTAFRNFSAIGKHFFKTQTCSCVPSLQGACYGCFVILCLEICGCAWESLHLNLQRAGLALSAWEAVRGEYCGNGPLPTCVMKQGTEKNSMGAEGADSSLSLRWLPQKKPHATHPRPKGRGCPRNPDHSPASQGQCGACGQLLGKQWLTIVH